MAIPLSNLRLTLYAMHLCERHASAMDSHRLCHPNHGLWQAQVYEADARPRVLDALPIALDQARLEHEDYFVVAIVRRAAVLKALDSFLRYALVTGTPLAQVSMLIRPGGEFAGLRGDSRDGSQLELRVHRLRYGHPVIQSGNRAAWFDAARWIHSGALEGGVSQAMARPLRFAECHRAALVDVGAIEVKPKHWLPPLGSATDDLASFVWQRSRRSRGFASKAVHG